MADSGPVTTDPLPATDPRSPGFKDRRNFPRRRPRGSAAFVLAAKPMAPSSAITLINISQSGISFLASKPLELGQRILIDLLAPGHGRPLTVEAEVRWISPAAKAGKHLVGCAWLKRVCYSDLIRFF
jgi:PilZ domain